MPWARLDDRMPWNRKVRPMSDGAFRLFVSAICWSAENLTDGVILTTELPLVSDVRSARKRAVELTERGLWELIPNVGWRIHDYLEYNPTADQVRLDRAAKTARQQRWRERRNQPEPPPDEAHVDASTDASQDPSRDASGDAAPRARTPAPSRPDPTPPQEREKGDPRGDQGQGALSLIPEGWQPSGDDIRIAQKARTDHWQPVLTGGQIAEVTRKFLRRQTSDRRQLTPEAWGARWQEWAERERPTETEQPGLLLGLDGGLAGPAWAHEMPGHTMRSVPAPVPLQTCDDCSRAFRAAGPGLCGDCRADQSDTA